MADRDLYTPDGNYAPDFICRRVTKHFRGYKGLFHGTMQSFFLRPELQNPIMFEVFYDEDQSIAHHNYPQLLRILDASPHEEASLVEVFNAEDVVEDDRGTYLPDVVPTRREMLQQPDKEHFIAAERTEMENMQRHGVFQWVVPPRGVRLVRSKFTYKRKRDTETNKITKYKARLVARCFTQIYGIDFTDTYAPTATAAAFRLLMIVAMQMELEVTTGDIDGAFLNPELEEDIYMSPPPGFEDPKRKGEAIKLIKSIYGLKQSARCWHLMLKKELIALRYTAIDASDCFWQLANGKDLISLIVIHVDDYVHAFSEKWLDNRIVQRFTELWGVSGVGPVKHYLGMHIDYQKGERVRIDQRAYCERILKRFSFENVKAAPTPLDPAVKLSVEDCPAEVNEVDHKLFMEIYGSLLYAAVSTRPDIAKAMTALGRFMANPGPAHVIAIKRVLRYVAGTLDRGLKYTNKPWLVEALGNEVPPHEIINFTDSDWAGDIDTRNSTSATCTFVAGGPVSWLAKLQHIQAQSSGESEYIAMGDGAKDLMYVRNALRELRFYPAFGPTKMLVDSSAALGIASRPGINNKTKHIALRYHFVRHHIADGEIAPVKCDTLLNVADVLTKAVDRKTFQRLAPMLVKSVKRDAVTKSSGADPV